MAFKSKSSPKRNCVTQLHDYLNKYVTYDSDVCSYELISLSSSIPVKEFSISLLAAEIWKGSLDLGRPSTDLQSLLQIAFISQDNYILKAVWIYRHPGLRYCESELRKLVRFLVFRSLIFSRSPSTISQILCALLIVYFNTKNPRERIL